MKQLYLYVFTIMTLIHTCTLFAKEKPDFSLRMKKVERWRDYFRADQDSTEKETDSVIVYDVDPTRAYLGLDSLNVKPISKVLNVTLHQMLKGNVAGVYVQETSGEPGTIQQNTLIRGVSHPVLTPYDVSKNKPLILLNGIPLIDDPTIMYDIQAYTVQPIGAATNLQSIIDIDNVKSIHILKDLSTTAIYGPRAANGVIYITTKEASAGQRKISVNSQYGFATPSNVSTINAEFEKNFRAPFYEKYAGLKQLAIYPSYLSDSSNVNYYGPSNWTDLYYKNTPVYTVNGSLEGGSNRANFRFFGNYMKDAAASDDTGLKRYQAAFYLNMLPMEWFTVSAMLQGTRLQRDRNKSIIERLAETGYIPDMTTPLSPNKQMYAYYLSEMDRSIDENYNTSLLGSLNLNFEILQNLNFSPKVLLDYNENVRNVFWPSTLMSSNNYVSNYFGFNQRIAFDNALTYKLDLENHSSVLFEGGFNYQSDTQKYNFIQGYKGQNDDIKVNQVEGNSQKAAYLIAQGFIPFYFQDRIDYRLASFYGRLTYSKSTQYELAALIRRDGSSAVQPSNRWFTSYAVNGRYDLNALVQSEGIQSLNLFASWGKLGNIPTNDTDAAGPQYSADLGWTGTNPVYSFNGLGTISRPYQSGWVGYDLPWSYTNMVNVGLDIALKSNVANARVEFYNKDTKDMTFSVPTVAESGYEYERLSGMSVNNKGVDLTLDFNLFQNRPLQWSSSLNIAYNTNELTALPNDLQSLVVGTNKLEVGNRIDQFWVFQNRGIYINDLDVPVRASDYKLMTYKGTAMKGGDPRWIDVDNNYEINDNDRILSGNYIPKYTGGFFNRLMYKNIDLNFLLYFNIKKDILNEQAAAFMDFGNRDEASGLSSVRDITFWEKNFDETMYPQYNPWSAVSPYQVGQDMFIEDGSFLKLKNVTLGYDFASLVKKNLPHFSRVYLYVTGTNLYTFTKYSGRDPELVNFYGHDAGLGLRFPKTYILGIKLDF